MLAPFFCATTTHDNTRQQDATRQSDAFFCGAIFYLVFRRQTEQHLWAIFATLCDKNRNHTARHFLLLLSREAAARHRRTTRASDDAGDDGDDINADICVR